MRGNIAEHLTRVAEASTCGERKIPGAAANITEVSVTEILRLPTSPEYDEKVKGAFEQMVKGAIRPNLLFFGSLRVPRDDSSSGGLFSGIG